MIPIGIQEQGGSEELDERVTAIENQEDMENVFVAMQNFSFQDNILTIYSGWIWKLLGVNYSNPANVSFPIDFCAAGKSRFEYIVPNNENGFTRITGQETLGTAQAPQLPAHGLYVTFFLVTDSEIGIPQSPNIEKTPTIQEVTNIGYSTTNPIWFYNNSNSKCIGINSERLLFQKLESVFNEVRADNTTESYNVQLPSKTGGAEETIAMVSDLENKEDKTNKGVVNGYAPLNEFVKIASDYLNIVNDLVTGGTTSLASAETVKTLKNQINAINLLLSSDNVNLDNVQEIVDAIETVQTSLNTILVNDLTTGGTTKALTAEMGKILKGLIDALTTLVGNKVDKVAGERLINAAEITKLAGLGSIATTVKTILSTALATQNVAGFVTYINALNPVLVVGASEIVKYNLTDTGRVFELNLRGRSFGTGQPAIVAADVLEFTDFLNKDIKLSNYPSTRNDGQLPTNKVFAPDANGNVKLYSIAIAPAPWIKELIPDSYLPDTTGNIRILGDFFTPEMCNRVTNPNAIIIGGVATIHYATFVNSQEILANVTTGSVEGNFSITLNNGLQTVKNSAFLIVLGTVFKPLTNEWINIQEPIEINNDKVLVENYGVSGSAIWNKEIDYTKNWRLRFIVKKTPFGVPSASVNLGGFLTLEFLKVSNNALAFGMKTIYQGSGYLKFITLDETVFFYYTTNQTEVDNFWNSGMNIFEYRKIGANIYVYYNGVSQGIISQTLTENVKVKISATYSDVHDVKYIETA